jgi:hypothetical protein
MIIWLASYPKSGNTWLRSLIATYFYSKNNLFDFDLLKKIDQFPSTSHFEKYEDLFIKPESTAKFWLTEQNRINQDKKIRFFKTHNALCKINDNSFTDISNTLCAIHIVRDPRNIVSSLAHHYQINKEEAFEFMKDNKKALIEKKGNRFLGFVPLFSWIFHEKSWSECKKFPVLTIRYEDLQNETFQTFKKVYEFLKKITKIETSFDREKTKKIIRSCDFNTLKKLENEKGFKESMTIKGTNKKLNFFNLGHENQYQNLLDEKLIDQMNFLYQEQLQKYNYE